MVSEVFLINYSQIFCTIECSALTQGHLNLHTKGYLAGSHRVVLFRLCFSLFTLTISQKHPLFILLYLLMILISICQILFLIIMIFYCGLMVHITDTRAQKVVSCTSAHITDTVLAYDQHWEEQSSLSSPQLYRHSQKHRKWITIQQGITQSVLVRVQP